MGFFTGVRLALRSCLRRVLERPPLQFWIHVWLKPWVIPAPPMQVQVHLEAIGLGAIA